MRNGSKAFLPERRRSCKDTTREIGRLKRLCCLVGDVHPSLPDIACNTTWLRENPADSAAGTCAGRAASKATCTLLSPCRAWLRRGLVTPWLMAEGRNQRVQGDNPQASSDANSEPLQRLVRRGSSASGARLKVQSKPPSNRALV